MTRESDTQVVIGALENARAQWRRGDDLERLLADDATRLAADLRSGEMTLAHCADDECSHGWHYTEHGEVQAMLVDLGGRSALALLLSVLMVCATLLLLAEMVMAAGTPQPGIADAFATYGAP